MKKIMFLLILLTICSNIAAEDLKAPAWDIKDFYLKVNKVRRDKGLQPCMRMLALQNVADDLTIINAKTETLSMWYSNKQLRKVFLDNYKLKVKNIKIYMVKYFDFFSKTVDELIKPAFDKGSVIFDPEINAVGFGFARKDIFYYLVIIGGTDE